MAAPVHSRTTRLQEYWISRRGGRVQERRRNGTGEHETMSLAIRIDAFGGPEVLQPADIAVPAPGPGELRVRNRAIGVNYVDVYHRTGLYPLPGLPAVPGVESVGIVEAVGPDVAGFKPGDRVAAAGLPVGAYAAERLIPAGRVVPVPDDIDDRTAAAGLF